MNRLMRWLLVGSAFVVMASLPTAATGQEPVRLEGSATVTYGDGPNPSVDFWELTPRCSDGPCDTDFTHIYYDPASDDGFLTHDAVLTFDGDTYRTTFEIGTFCTPFGVAANHDGASLATLTVELGSPEPIPNRGSTYRLSGSYAVELGAARDLNGCVTWEEPAGTAQLEIFVEQEVGPTALPSRREPSSEPSAPDPGVGSVAPTVAPSVPPVAQPPDVSPDGVVAAAHGRGQAVLAASLAAPKEVSTDLGDLATSGIIAALLALFVVFPSELFNRTLEQHHDEIVGWFRRRRVPETGAAPPIPGGEAADTPTSRRGWLAFAIVTLLSGALYGLLDPGFGLNRSSLVAVVGVVAAIVVLTLAGGLAGGAYLKRRYGDASYRVRAYPAALVVAGVCVLVSRLVDFQPGYLYGLIAGFAFRRQLDDPDEARQTLVTSVALLLFSLVVWVAWAPLNTAVERGDAALPVVVADSALAAVVVAGLEGLLFGLLPLRFLSGDKLFRWSKPIWFVVYLVAALAFLQVVVRPGGGPVTDSSTLTVLILFGVFAAISIAFWAYFRYRETPATT